MVKRTAALALGLVAGIAILELALRAIGALAPPPPAPELRDVPGGGPVVSRWLSAGEREPAPRVLVVGDSFTVGRGVALDQVYPARLAASLGELGHSVEVVSFSFPGWNTKTEAVALRRHIDDLEPDVLVVGHCLNDAEKRPTAQATADRPDLRPWAPGGPFETFLDRRSRLYSRIRRALDALRLRPILRAYYAQLYEDPEGLRAWRRSLRSIRRMAAERGIPAVLVVFPIFDSDLDSDYPYRELHALVTDSAEELGFASLDLLGSYEGHDGRELALVPYTDPHPSALAHEIAGREIARYLHEHAVVGERGLDSGPR